MSESSYARHEFAGRVIATQLEGWESFSSGLMHERNRNWPAVPEPGDIRREPLALEQH
jgi:hypothetical protein